MINALATTSKIRNSRYEEHVCWILLNYHYPICIQYMFIIYPPPPPRYYNIVMKYDSVDAYFLRFTLCQRGGYNDYILFTETLDCTRQMFYHTCTPHCSFSFSALYILYSATHRRELHVWVAQCNWCSTSLQECIKYTVALPSIRSIKTK